MNVASRVLRRLPVADPNRALALGSAVLLYLSFASVLYGIAEVVSRPPLLVGLLVAAAAAATALSRVLRLRTAVLLGLVLFVGGLGWYLLELPPDALDFDRFESTVLEPFLALLTGLSVLRIVNVELWVLVVSPGPVFLGWYLAMRRHYVGSAVVGVLGLLFFVLTGDVEAPTALLGTLGAAGAVGFGELDWRDATVEGAEVVAVFLAAMVVVTLSFSVVPGTTAQPLSPGGGGQTVESTLVDADDRVRILGSIELSPAVRFAVTSDEQAYWRVGAYDRYTGDGWVRSGTDQGAPARDSGPGQSRTVTQRYRVESRLDVMPAVWRPVRVQGSDVQYTSLGGVSPAEPLAPGDTYQVTSERPVATPEQLRSAGTDYPDRIETRYLQLPSSTPDRVARRTERITANAETPYDTARVIERWLENTRRYSLDVDRPDGNVADAFLFEMSAGYCTYYATTMVTMLRSQGVPARFAVGYTSGERVDRDRWVARGLDSHAWVEVYFPEVGWVRFDPTPAGPREAAEQSRLDEARAENESNVDTNETGGSEYTPTPASTPRFTGPNRTENPLTTPNASTAAGGPARSTPTAGRPPADDDRGGFSVPELPSRETAALSLFVLFGAAAGVRRSGLGERAYRAVWLRWQPRADPERDVERAFDRLEYLLGRRHRPRRPGETVRQYVDAVDADDRARRVAELYERARYAGRVSAADADEAVALVGELVGDR